MKKTLLLLMGLLTALLAQAQAPAWDAVYSIGPVDSNYSDVRVMAADNSGNLYLAGNFSGVIGVGGTLLTATGNSLDVFVAKWSTATSSFVWAQRVGGAGEEQVNALAVNGSAVYVGGAFRSSAVAFGATTLTNTNLNSGTGSNGFIARLTDAGSSAAWAWAQQVAPSSYEGVRALAVSGTSLYATGAFESATTTLGSFTLTNSGTQTADLYVAKLSDSGSSAAFIWVARTSGAATASEQPGGLAVVGGSVYLAGTFGGSVSFSPSSPALTAVAANGGFSAFVAKLTDAGSSGSFAWATAAGGAGEAVPLSLVARGTSLYMGGLFRRGPATFGSTTLTKAGVATDYTSDGFVASLTDAGATPSFGWALRAGGTASDSTTALVATPGGVYVVGKFTSSADVGSTTLVASQQPFLTNRYDAFAARIAEAGGSASWAWAQRAGGPYYDAAFAVAVSGSRLYAAGFATPVADFSTFTVSGKTQPTGFLASIADQALPARATTELAGFTVFPNPAPGAATLRVPAGAGTATVRVLDALGRLVQQAPVAAGQDYALTGLAPGVYAVRVQVGEATAVQRLAVE